MGKIIQITSAGNDGGMMLYALCDDGNVWEFCIQTGWVKLPLPDPSPNSDCSKCPCCDAPWNIRENDSCSCGAFIAKRS